MFQLAKVVFFVTDSLHCAQRAEAYRSFGLIRTGDDATLSVLAGGMHRSNELAAALALPQLAALESRVIAANANLSDLVAGIKALPGHMWGANMLS